MSFSSQTFHTDPDMISMIRSFVVVLLCWVVIAQEGDTGTILDLVSLCNGVFDNTDQVKSDEQKRDIIIGRMIPVKTFALGGPAFYFDENLNEHYYRQEMVVVTGEKNGLIYLTPSNFTDSSRPDPENLKPNDLDNLKAEDLQPSDPSCRVVVEEVVPGVYEATWPDCRVTINKLHPFYTLIFSCDDLQGTTGANTAEAYTVGANRALRVGGRFPAKNLPANYVGPCDRKK